MAKKILVGVSIVFGVAFIGLVVLMHSSYGRDTYQMIRKIHGK